jgi:hypothetical protein
MSEQYSVKISNRFATLGTVDYNADINKACGSKKIHAFPEFVVIISSCPSFLLLLSFLITRTFVPY